MCAKINIYSHTLESLRSALGADIPPFRAKQIYNWLYTKYTSDFKQMKNLPKALIERLESEFCAKNLKILRVETSKDGTKKYLFGTKDGHSFESVLLKMRDKSTDESGKTTGEKFTICLSSQVGCKVGCAFCYTAKSGFTRNLEAGEIVEQVVAIKRDNALAAEKRVNLVYMGMGEPLDNFENVTLAVKIFSELEGLSIAPRRQTISTSGIASKIERLGKMNLGVLLAISLHAVDDATRTRLIPMNRAYNIARVLDAVRRFPIDLRKRVMFEYLMISGVNDGLDAARALLRLLDGIRAKVNLILFNPHEGSEFERPSVTRAREFADFLISRGLLATIRESKGIDISAACGQLREKNGAF